MKTSRSSDSDPGTGEPAVFVRKRRPRQPKQPIAGAAQREIDTRLAEALKERAEAMKKVSALVYYQDRLARLNQEIDSLLGYQQRLMGQAPTIAGYRVHEGNIPLEQPPISFSHTAQIPPGVGSMPTRAPKPAATPNGNAADVVGGEAGFQ